MKSTLVKSEPGELLASVQAYPGGQKVTLPPELAKPAVERFLSQFHVEAIVLEEPSVEWPEINDWPDGGWCLLLRATKGRAMLRMFPATVLGKLDAIQRGDAIFICLWFPVHSIVLGKSHVRHLQRSLERVKEERFQDESGAPLPWVTPDAASAPVVETLEEEAASAACWESEDALSSFEPPEDSQPIDGQDHPIPREQIVNEFERIREHLSLPPFELSLFRGASNKNGFVTGRVFTRQGTPVRMVLSTCPNADLAEISATLVHEFAHITSGMGGHDLAFKEALLNLAAALYGDAYFVAARDYLKGSFRVLDMWLATGIRAVLRNQEPPVAKDFDESLTAGVVSRIQKMRALATDQPGTPEGLTATGIANTQSTLFGLGSYHLKWNASVDESMVDRWLNIGKKVRWKRELAFDVASFCNVFALARPDRGWMHFFGKYRDVIAAEYLFHVCLEHIERQCNKHIAQWKAQQGRVSSGQVRSEKVSFCASAVEGISDKMDRIREMERAQAQSDPTTTDARAFQLTSKDLQQAEVFATDEHKKRGMGWGSDSSHSYHHNESGYEAGQAVELRSGVNAGKVRGLLGG